MIQPIEQALSALCAIEVGADYLAGAELIRATLPEREGYWARVPGLQLVAHYIQTAMPDMFDPLAPFGIRRPLRVLDVGPGPGFWLEFAREAGHEVEGAELFPYSGLVQGYNAMTTDRGLNVGDQGFPPASRGPYDVIHSRGSIGGVLAVHTPRARGPHRILWFLDECESMLNPGGVVHVSHNAWDGMEEMISVMEGHGLEFERIGEYDTRHRKIRA